MKALSLTRPWPELILRCGKNVENRTWNTTYRGQVLLHAAQSWAPTGIQYAEYVALRLGRDLGVATLARHKSGHPTGIVGVAEITGVCRATVDRVALCLCGPWAMHGQHHWQLANPRPLPEPVPCRGALGLWTPPDHVAAAVAAQLTEESRPC